MGCIKNQFWSQISGRQTHLVWRRMMKPGLMVTVTGRLPGRSRSRSVTERLTCSSEVVLSDCYCVAQSKTSASFCQCFDFFGKSSYSGWRATPGKQATDRCTSISYLRNMHTPAEILHARTEKQARHSQSLWKKKKKKTLTKVATAAYSLRPDSIF